TICRADPQAAGGGPWAVRLREFLNKVFLDSGVLIAAFRGEQGLRDCALAVLSEPNLEFWYSPLVKLEVILQPTHRRRKAELEFYEEYFSHASCWGNLDRMFEIGGREAMKHGISVVDALHVAAAHLARCSLMITTEKPTKPLFRTKLVRVASIVGLANSTDTVRKLIGA
ncbi:MAG TPA: PIN domain-containing protein, partial [Bryobacteraceae bacterium]